MKYNIYRFFMALKITKIKIQLAKVLYFVVRLFYKSDKQIVRRQGINFELYLNEGIYLSMFVLGGFQKHVYHHQLIKIAPDDVIFDVGGNVGIMSLFFAQQASEGQVHSFEPTWYAIEKFRNNLDLNPDLFQRITLNHCFVSSESSPTSNLVAYSSWPVVHTGEATHPIHRGVAKDAQNISCISLDDYVTRRNMNKIDVIKIDTDGHELHVLRGAEEILKKFRPKIIFEIGIYIMEERDISFKDYAVFFQNHCYTLFTTKGKSINENNYCHYIPKFGTIDVLALPSEMNLASPQKNNDLL